MGESLMPRRGGSVKRGFLVGDYDILRCDEITSAKSGYIRLVEDVEDIEGGVAYIREVFFSVDGTSVSATCCTRYILPRDMFVDGDDVTITPTLCAEGFGEWYEDEAYIMCEAYRGDAFPTVEFYGGTYEYFILE